MIKIHRKILFFFIPILLSANLFSAELEGIAVIDVEAAILSTELAKQAFEELSNSKEWKEVSEEFQLKVNEAQEIAANVQKDGTTMSDEEKNTTLKKNDDCSCFPYEQDINDPGPALTHAESCVYYGTGLHCKPVRKKVQALIDKERNRNKKKAVRLCEEAFILSLIHI